MTRGKAFEAPDPADTDPGPNRIEPELADRVKQAVQSAGGVAQVAQASGIATRSLTRYLAGYEMKRPALVALAEACNVTLEWLATGKGPMRPGESPPPPAPEPAAAPRYLPLFGAVDMETMGEAIEVATIAFAARNIRPSWRRKAQVYCLIYDILHDPKANAQGVQQALSSALAEDEKSPS